MHTLTILGKRWFQRTYGNTYHSADILIDGVKVGNTGIHYGYDDQYVYTAFKYLGARGLLPAPIRDEHGRMEVPRLWCDKHGITLHYSASDVAREKDLK